MRSARASGFMNAYNVTGKCAQVFIVVAGSTLVTYTHTLTTNGADIASLAFSQGVPVAAGDAVRIDIIDDAGTSANFKQGALYSRVMFRVVP